jgi:hypothetical protein
VSGCMVVRCVVVRPKILCSRYIFEKSRIFIITTTRNIKIGNRSETREMVEDDMRE